MLLKLLLLIALAGTTAQQPVLDLTNAPKPDRRFKPTTGVVNGISAGGAIDGPPTPGPLALSLLSISSPDAANEVVYEARLTNNKDERVCIPKDPLISDLEPLKPEQYWYSEGTLDLTVTDARGKIITVGLMSLYDDVNHSHCDWLAPKASLVIRAKTKLEGAFDSQPLPAGKLQARARWTSSSAHVWFDREQIHGDTSSTPPTMSTNAVTICVKECAP
jgi:hypothetical protein